VILLPQYAQSLVEQREEAIREERHLYRRTLAGMHGWHLKPDAEPRDPTWELTRQYLQQGGRYAH
jgi:hypothetical protein